MRHLFERLAERDVVEMSGEIANSLNSRIEMLLE
jgi:hypothetical protein